MRDCALGQQSRQHATGSLFWSEKPMYGSISYPSNIYLSQHLSQPRATSALQVAVLVEQVQDFDIAMAVICSLAKLSSRNSVSGVILKMACGPRH